MNVLLLCSQPTILNSIAHKVIPDGVNLIKCNTMDEIVASVPVKGNICLLDQGNLNIETFIKAVHDFKKTENKKGARIIAIIKNPDVNVINLLTKIGVDLTLQNSMHSDSIAERFEVFIKRIAQEQHSERKFIRIKPDETESMMVGFYPQNSKSFIEGKVTDISMGGLAAKFGGSEMLQLIDGAEYYGAQIGLLNKKITADLRLVKKGGEIAAFSFSKIRDAYKDALAEYIYSKIQKNLEPLN